MLPFRRSFIQAFRLLPQAAIVGVAFCAIEQIATAQLRTGRGTREFYVEGNAPQQREAEVQQASYQPSDDFRTSKPTTTGLTSHQRTSNRNQAQATRHPASLNRRSQPVQRASAQAPAVEPIPMAPENTVLEPQPTSGCDTCGDLGCDSCGCGPDPCYSQPMCIDLGSGPIASLIAWMTQNMYFRGEAAVFQQNGLDLPILATTGVAAANGVLPAAPVLFGGDEVNNDARLGYRFRAGLWLDPCFERALEVRGFDTGDWTTTFQENTNTVGTGQLLARPIRDNGVATSAILVSANHTTVTGSLDIGATSNTYGGDILLRRRLNQHHNVRWDLLVGYQGVRMDDDLVIQSSATQAVVGGFGTVDVRDSFLTRNEFDGMALGFSRFSRLGPISLDGRFTLGMGNLRRGVLIEGSQTSTVRNGAGVIQSVNTQTQGLLARNTNAGNHIDDTFVVLPELGLGLGYALTPNLDFTIGYTHLSLPKVARAGDQIQNSTVGPVTNTTAPPVGEVAPVFNLQTQTLWQNSFNFGAQWRF